MARTKAPEMNKSAAIRDYKSNNPAARPRDIAAALQEQGYDVNAQYVSVVLSNLKKKKGKKKRGAPRGSGKAAAVGVGTGTGVGLAELKLAKQLYLSAGGAKEARQAVDTIAQLLG